MFFNIQFQTSGIQTCAMVCYFFCYSKKDLLASFLRSLESVDWVIFKYWAIYFNGTKEDMYFMGARLKEP